MTMYVPNPDVRPTGAEAGEFLDPSTDVWPPDDEELDADPTRRPSGAPPLAPD